MTSKIFVKLINVRSKFIQLTLHLMIFKNLYPADLIVKHLTVT